MLQVPRFLKKRAFVSLIFCGMKKVYCNVFLISAAVILFFTACAKLTSAFGAAPILKVDDPIFSIPNYILLGLAALLEFGTVVYICFSRDTKILCLWISVFGAFLLLYRIAFKMGGFSRGCPCLGTLGSSLPVSQSTQNIVLLIFALWLCGGGWFGFLISEVHSRDNPVKAGA